MLSSWRYAARQERRWVLRPPLQLLRAGPKGCARCLTNFGLAWTFIKIASLLLVEVAGSMSN